MIQSRPAPNAAKWLPISTCFIVLLAAGCVSGAAEPPDAVAATDRAAVDAASGGSGGGESGGSGGSGGGESGGSGGSGGGESGQSGQSGQSGGNGNIYLYLDGQRPDPTDLRQVARTLLLSGSAP